MNKKFINILILLCISFISYYGWIFFDVFSAGDSLYFFSSTIYSFPFFSTWSSIYDIGLISITLWRLPSDVLYYIGGGPSLGLKLWQYIPYIVSTPLAAYIFIKEYFKSRSAVFGGALFFMANTYYLAINSQAHIPLSIASNLMIISYVFFKRAWQYNTTYYWVIWVISLFLTGSYDFRFVYIGYIIFLIHVIFNIKQLDLKRIIQGFIFNILFIILNIYWLLPFAQTGGGDGLGRPLFGVEFWKLTNAITLYHPFWRVEDKIMWFDISSIPLYYWFIPIIVFISIAISFKNRTTYFFTFVLIIGLFLSKMNNPPFVNIYPWLYENIPGFNAFREPTKFYSIILLSYTFFISNIIQLSKGVTKFILVSFIFVVFIININPIFTRTAGELYKPVNVDEDYKKFANFVREQDEYFRVMWVPRQSKFAYTSNQNPSISSVFFMSTITPLGEVMNIKSDLYNRVILPESKFINRVVDNYNIKYFVVPNQSIENNDNEFFYYGGIKDPYIRNWYISELDKIDWLEKKDFGFSELVVYENKDYKDRIYLTQEPETIYKDIEEQKVEFRQITPAEYRVKINNLDETAYLNFVESYDPNWKMRIGDFDWYKVLYEKKYFVVESKHSKSEVGFNNFELSKEYIKSNFDKSYYKENPDGSIDVELTLYFKPQSYFYLGIIISGTTLILCLGYLGHTFYRQWRRKKFGINKNIHSNLRL